ncbi:MAG: branched-chain alpha-keto acid dehydrogenase subunit E2 [Gammaproteobacteria bacterium RIFCSPLOWO2_02_FULL_42_14]|nr:MAG: branched-chain alpha-keto acid dehydrogenase subunit E2 [Gammaproteobacteria bacterium RIFCSPHIGHO2_02_FULL_42_43]OGT51188.1 MAG: branched-chain alpha-keto acid dehydrogenase subunit E2 [Gammaproteobacteria bacterium RIFCSPHIGHO2_12_FULL_41_25]OGT62950.1 MAG: branched-chain alpha-keto acid dehydrogenase subunit E2 [Gammaproteobacteria bacterium RIFCSPLOWO2_02_FULL_42_14]OGT86082.1 MAG: branched-chain alpha-keto acid dehydrogenase subunit E2 [Gammaproteobacteria bacterium RIFCSPLOWO2_12_F
MGMTQQVLVPDIGGAADVAVIAVMISPGDAIVMDTPLVTLEGDKASMDVPSPVAGVVESVVMKVGDKVSEGVLICTVKVAATVSVKSVATAAPTSPQKTVAALAREVTTTQINDTIHASPAVRRLAHEVGVNLSKIKGSGEKGRITKDDLKNYVTGHIQKSESGFSLPLAPSIDFSKFGAIKTKPLSKIQKASGANLHRNWISIPHVTQFIAADITALEKYRNDHKKKTEDQGYKLTPLVFIMKAVTAALKEFPTFNASLNAAGDELILKQYFHIGVAVDTSNGLVVPVIRDVDQKDIFVLAKELNDISKKARDGQLTMKDMQGGCFSISSLGGIGGTAFTPIINAPEVAILGVSKSSLKPHFEKEKMTPRLMLPLSLSYDHRVIDGALAARFAVFVTHYLETEYD